MRRGGFIRIATALTVAAAALAATGTPALASAHSPRMRAFTPRLLPSIALPAGLDDCSPPLILHVAQDQRAG